MARVDGCDDRMNGGEGQYMESHSGRRTRREGEEEESGTRRRGASRLVFGSQHIPLILVFLLLVCLPLVSAYPRQCSGHYELKSKMVKMEMVDGNAIFSALDESGNEIPDFFHAELLLSEISEENRYYDPDLQSWQCHSSQTASGSPYTVQFFPPIFSDWNCSTYYSESFPFNDTLLRAVTVNYTHADYPGMVVSNTFYATNKSFTISPSSNTTFVDPSQTYLWRFDENGIKFNYDVEGFPFIGSPTPFEGSNAQIFFKWNVSLVDTLGYFIDDTYEGRMNLTQLASPSRPRRSVFISFEKGVLFDGIPFLKADLNPLGVTAFADEPLSMDLTFFSGVPLCPPYHWNYLTYDPSVLVSIFSSPVPDDPSSSSSPQHIRDRKTATILGAVFGSLVALVVIIVIILTLFVPSFKHMVLPFTKPRELTSSTRLGTSPDDHAPSSSSSSSSSWTRPTKPVS